MERPLLSHHKECSFSKKRIIIETKVYFNRLFRVFTPSILLTLYECRAINEDYKDLYQRLKEVEVISDDGPLLLGIMLSCTRNYSTLDDLNFNQSRKERLLYSLLNSRLILAALHGALALKKLHYPEDLDQLKIIPPPNGEYPPQMPVPGTGKDLYQWACAIEKGVCEAIDSFGPLPHDGIESHDTLNAFSLISPDCITFNGAPIAHRVLVMLDNVHKLTTLQRQKLLSILFDLRPKAGVWIAERLETLRPDELMAIGATTGREYGEPIILESFWRAKSKRFKKAIINIADRRAKTAHDARIESFVGHLQSSLDGAEWQGSFERALETISERVRRKVGYTPKYKKWIETRESNSGTPRELAIMWRTLEILIERDKRRTQQLPLFDSVLPPEELERKDASAVESAAEFFIAQEFKLPYYFGISHLATLSSSNIEQFLAFSGKLFEEMISASLLKLPNPLALVQQELILKKVVKQRWEEIPRRVSNGKDVQRLLEAIQQCGHWENSKPNVPYTPMVTGIAMTMANRDKIIDSKIRQKHPEYERLISAFSACLSNNLLEVSMDRKQGQKGKTWMILYLNRWLCLYFGLPLHYGGWRPKTPDELCEWLESGFHPPQKVRGGRR